MAVKKASASNDSKQPATKSDINALRAEFKAELNTSTEKIAELMTEGIAYLSNGQESLKEEMGGVKSRLGNVENRLEDVEKRLEKVEVQVSDTNRRLRDVEFDTPTLGTHGMA